jgi:hypothetical protein
MSGIDRTTPNDELEVLLRSWMGEQRPDADLTSAYDVIVDATRGARQRPWFLVRRGIRRTTPPSGWFYRGMWAAAVILAVLIVALTLAAGFLVGGPPQRLDQVLPSSAPAGESPSPAAPARVLEDTGTLVLDTRYTSRLFEPAVTFKASPRTAGGAEADICPSVITSSRSIVFAHPKGCVEDLRIIRPWAVACGTAGDHPDADALAAAILALPATTSSTDLGALDKADPVPPAMFAAPFHGRVVQMLGYGPQFAADVDDRDHCRLLPDPGTDDPVIEIRRDMSALFVLVDVDGELIVIRASVAGHDAASGAEAQARGYGQGGADQLRHLLGLVTDIRFGP